ncbi:16477_t:CDS:2 [Acaulospora morrowiae]|uniref:16477_t:CDS:1 n=1 Tax=Acaulospora morrowiae TaxID=94023 RepID=A0A9N9F9F2_9GLOM|nr:16477_t:CDS:2 [Acaulospora morrowiae]
MPGTTSKPPTNESELSADLFKDENLELDIDEILKDIDKTEGALKELDDRLDNFNAKIDALLSEQPTDNSEVMPTTEESKVTNKNDKNEFIIEVEYTIKNR